MTKIKKIRFGAVCTIVGLVLVKTTGAYAQGKCRQLFDSGIGTARAEFEKTWDIRRFPDLDVKDILPPEFIDNIEREVGPIKISTVRKKRDAASNKIASALVPKLNHRESSNSTVEVALTTKKTGVFIQFRLIADPTRPRLVEVDHLFVTNPLVNQMNDKLHLSQNKKGLPYSVFKIAKDNIVSAIKRSGVETIYTTGGMNFLVSKLYQKFFGMKPTVTSARHVESIDRLFYFYSRNADALGLKSIDQFSRVLESAHMISEDFVHDEHLWQMSVQSGASEKFFRRVYDGDKLVALIKINAVVGERDQTYFLDPEDNSRFYHWLRIYLDKGLELTLGL